MATRTDVMYNDPPAALFRAKKAESGDGATLTDEQLVAVFKKHLEVVVQLPAGTSGLNKKALEDTTSRIGLLSAKLEEHAVSAAVVAHLQQIAEALEKDDFKKAFNLHVSLITDHFDEVGQWMTGLKRLLSILSTTAATTEKVEK